jgi:hypothetical protein
MPRAIDSPTKELRPGLGLLSPGASIGPLLMPDHGAFEGVEWVAETCGVVRLYPGVCDDTPPTKAFPEGVGAYVDALPFLVYASEVCAVAGRSTSEAEARIRRKLAMREQWGVERALIGGDTGVTGLLDGAGLVSLGAATSMKEALALLEQNAAEQYGLPITIHAVPGVASYAGGEGVLQTTPRNELPITWNGNRVVFGQGYENVTPAGGASAAGVYTIWATGPIVIWRDAEAFVPPARQVFNKSTNQLAILAERAYLMAYECYAAAVTVTLEA